MKWIFLLLFPILAFAENSFYSQFGQDQFVYENFFKGNKEGVFVEIGAHDGISFSNTYFFEKELGWKGFCIEPIPEIFEKLKNNRTAKCIQGCISDKKGTAEFLRIEGSSEMLSGLKEKYHPSHLKRIEKEIQESGGEKKVIQVPCFSFNDFAASNQITRIDYLSLDTEGGEWEILQSIDFQTVDIDTISVENNYNDKRFHQFLSSKGYVLIKSLHCDEIYKKQSFKPLVSEERPSLHFIQQFLPENPIIVEAGAHVGNDTVIMSKVWKKGTIYAFEPSPEVYKKLKKACKKRKNVKTFEIALADRIGKAEFYASAPSAVKQIFPSDAQGSLLPPDKENWAWPQIEFQKPVSVPVTTLDAWAKANKVQKIDFLWLDMQGSEYSMLKASPEILKTVKVIQTEVSRRPFYQGTVLLDEMQTWLENQGFIPIYITPEEHGDALFVRKNRI